MQTKIFETEITSRGIQKVLNKYTPEKSIAEYVWNGFDANATEVNISISSSELNMMEKIVIQDNGIGIDYNTLDTKFMIFMESRKSKKSEDGHRIKGKNGSGRLTFFKLASDAKWNTIYSENGENFEYSINISVSNLKEYSRSEKIVSNKKTGTTVILENITLNDDSEKFESSLKKYLVAEFAWFLELNKNRKIFINGEELEYDDYIGEEENWNIEVENHKFVANYFRWNGKLNDEYSRFYYLNSNGELIHQETTKLNKKGDNFYHTVIVKDSFYNDLQIDDIESANLFTTEEEKKIHRELENLLNEELKKKRRPFLHEKAVKWVNEAKEDGVFPKFSNNSWDKVREDALTSLVTEFYEVEPQIFVTLKKKQQIVLIALLNIVMETDSREDLFTILEEIVELEESDRNLFASILKRTKLKNVINLSNLVKDRLDTISDLKQLLFNHELKAGEIKHLQPALENHYWIFGEEFNLICAEEVKFEEALRRYKYYLYGIDEKTYIENPDKYKEMDLFLAGSQCKTTGYKQNLIIEIKSPTNIPKLTPKEFTQIQKYINVINSTDEFKTDKTEWVYFLIGQDYDEIVEMNIQVDKKSGLAAVGSNYKLYVKRWSDIIADVEARLNYLQNKLHLTEKEYSKDLTINSVMKDLQNNNSAIAEPEIQIEQDKKK